MIKCMPRKLQNVIERVGIIPPSISQRALQPNKEIFQPDRSVSRSCMYCNIVQWLNTVGVSISVFTRVSYVHMILENFCKTSGVVCEIYSLLRVFRIFVFFSASRNDRNSAKQWTFSYSFVFRETKQKYETVNPSCMQLSHSPLYLLYLPFI